MKKNILINKISNYIVKYRKLFLCFFIILTFICSININKIDYRTTSTSYLKENNETKKEQKIIEKEYNELNKIELLIKDISYEEAEQKVNEIKKLKNIKYILFDDNNYYYKDNNALIIIQSNNLKKIKELKKDIIKVVKENNYKLYTFSDKQTLKYNNTIIITLIIAILLILLTSHSYFDIIITSIIFTISIIINIGSNILIEENNFITIPIILLLQIGLTINYTKIFLDNYNLEIDDTSNKVLALKKTLSKSIPEIFKPSIISLSCLPIFMILKIGIIKNIVLVTIKTIICSSLISILLLPSLLIIFKNIILKLRHRIFIKDTPILSKLIISKYKILLTLTTIITISILIIPNNNLEYIISSNKSNINNKTQIEKTFEINNEIYLVIKNSKKDYNKELEISKKLLKDKKIVAINNVGNTKINSNLYLGSNINCQELSNILNIDLNNSTNIYKNYADKNDELINNIDNYQITFIDIISFLKENINEIQLDEETKTLINKYYDNIKSSKYAFENNNYSIYIIEFKKIDNTNQLLDTIKNDINKYYENVTMLGESITTRNITNTITKEKIILAIIIILIILIEILLIFKSLNIAIILGITSVASIIVNLKLASLINNKIYIMSYIFASIIQLIIKINYAFLITNRYLNKRKKVSISQSIKETYPIIITSGLIIISLCLAAPNISNSKIIESTIMILAQGIIITLISVILILPSLLYIFDDINRNKSKSKKIK